MTPEQLDGILAVLRKHGVMSATVPWTPQDTTTGGLMTFAGVTIQPTSLHVVFGPDPAPPPPGDETTPGGWKGPTRLDSDPLDDERSVP